MSRRSGWRLLMNQRPKSSGFWAQRLRSAHPKYLLFACLLFLGAVGCPSEVEPPQGFPDTAAEDGAGGSADGDDAPRPVDTGDGTVTPDAADVVAEPDTTPVDVADLDAVDAGDVPEDSADGPRPDEGSDITDLADADITSEPDVESDLGSDADLADDPETDEATIVDRGADGDVRTDTDGDVDGDGGADVGPEGLSFRSTGFTTVAAVSVSDRFVFRGQMSATMGDSSSENWSFVGGF